LLAVFLVVIFATGGSSRSDETQIVIWRPVSLCFCVFALFTVRREHIIEYRYLLAGLAAIASLALAHIVPLPPELWRLLPQGEYISTAEGLIGAKVGSQPLTLTPVTGWFALLTLIIPLTVVLFGIQLNENGRLRLLPLLIGLAAISGLIGLFQSIGNPDGPLYFYRITNNGSAVGLFANRNHAATLLGCLFPMLSVYAGYSKSSAEDQRRRKIWSAVIGVVLVPLILVTGSRSGLFIAIIGLGAAALIYPIPLRKNMRRVALPTGVVGGTATLSILAVLGLGALTVLFSRAEAIDRLFGPATGESRAEFIIVSIAIFRAYFPWGSGSGSFVEAYQFAEPIHLLDSTYLNRAHNDWVETVATFGLPGAVILAFGLLVYVRRTYSLWRNQNGARRSVMIGRMAGIAIGMIAVASLSDYPVRTPIMMSVVSIFALWFTTEQRTAPNSAQ
jgi:O-antigen ligase